MEDEAAHKERCEEFRLAKEAVKRSKFVPEMIKLLKAIPDALAGEVITALDSPHRAAILDAYPELGKRMSDWAIAGKPRR